MPEYAKVVALSPAHRDAYVNLGICLAQTGQLEEAERSFRQVLEIDPTFARGYTNLGALALVAGEMPGAPGTSIARRSRRIQNNVLARMQLASLYERAFHDYHAAARMCGEARAIAPSTPGVVECVERNQQLAAAKDRGEVMRILHAIHDFLPRHRAGSEIYACELAHEQSGRHDVFVLAAEYDPVDAARHAALADA